MTVQDNSPLELVQQFFTKLGARYVVVTDTDGHCTCLDDALYTLAAADVSRFLDEGVIDKKTWLAFLDQLEHKSG